MKDKVYCYFHAHLHKRSHDPYAKYAKIELPLPEDVASIRLSVYLISQAILSGTLDSKRTGHLLYGLQIAAGTIDRKTPFPEADTVLTTTESSDGEEIAPELRVCAKDERCDKCPHANDCDNFHEEDPNDPNVLMRTLISLGKHLDDPCPPGFFPPDQENYQQTDQDRKQIEAWRKRWGQPPAFQQPSQATDPLIADPAAPSPAAPSP
jgi:hypothetical protein